MVAHSPAPESERPLSPHQAKLRFRQLLPVFEGYWTAAAIGADEESAWPAYAQLLLTCQSVLDAAPMHPNEANQCNAERRLEMAMEQLATMLANVLPGGLPELEYYRLDAAKAEHRRQAEALRRRSVRRRAHKRAQAKER